MCYKLTPLIPFRTADWDCRLIYYTRVTTHKDCPTSLQRPYCHRHVVWGPICFVSRIDGIPPITGRDQAPLLEWLVDCMSGTVSLNEGGSGRTGE